MKYRRETVLFGSGVVALGLAGLAETLVRTKPSSGFAFPLYLLAIVLFAVKAWPLSPADQPAIGPAYGPTSQLQRWRSAALLFAGVVLAILTNVATLSRLNRGNQGATTAFLWVLSVAILLIAGSSAGRSTSRTTRWNIFPLPQTRSGQIVVVSLVVLLLLVGAATRFFWLDKVPFGINADEGDRAAVAIQIARGQNSTSVFGTGWYHISMVYFRLLALVMKSVALDFSGARLLGAICGFLTLAILTGIAFRHFGWRAGLLTAVLLSTLGVALQFSRETTEAAPTMTLWAVSAAFFLEAARRGKAWAWIGAGVAGGASIYFYPTGRLWPLLAVFYSVYLFLRGPERGRIAAGVALAAVAALLVMSPFLLNVWKIPNEFIVRARETSVFVPQNPTRLGYYQPGWNLRQLLFAQLDHGIGIFNKYPDQNYFWPTGRPILPAPLAALTLLGLGAVSLRVHDPRLFLLALWFWIGFAGVIVTVETPNLHRMATAVPLLGLFPALVLDDLARRAESASKSTEGARSGFPRTATAVALLVAVILAGREANFYFRRYAASDAWPYTRVEGQTIARQGRDAWVVSLASQYHMVNSGWVRLLGPFASRAGVLSPGSQLPPAVPADRDLAFLVYPGQPYYLPYLAELFPGGRRARITHPIDVFMFTLYRVPRAAWRERQGALAMPEGAPSSRVETIGSPPSGWSRFPSVMRWSATLRVSRYGNYAFRIGPGPALLTVDGKEVLRARPGEPTAETGVSLVRGDHQIFLEAVLARVGDSARLEWKSVTRSHPKSGDESGWQSIPTARLQPTDRPTRGLFGTIEVPARPRQYRLDPTIATGSLCQELEYCESFEAVWRGSLEIPRSGVYRMGLRAEGGSAELRLDGRPVVQSDGAGSELVEREVQLEAGSRAVELAFHPRRGPAALEWVWAPPGGEASIVPPSALSPPPGVAVGSPLPLEVLDPLEGRPADRPLTIVP